MNWAKGNHAIVSLKIGDNLSTLERNYYQGNVNWSGIYSGSYADFRTVAYRDEQGNPYTRRDYSVSYDFEPIKYDNLQRLISIDSVKNPKFKKMYQFTYDKNGNRLTATDKANLSYVANSSKINDSKPS